MKSILHVVISITVFGCLFTVHAQDGFAIWAKSGGCARELQYSEITNGTNVGPAKNCIPKGPGADIWPVISYDGEWIAWSRSPKAFNAKYGQCDYHSFGIWDLYIAKIDFGNTIPAKPIKVTHGYLPSWAMDENAKSPGKPKNLYYTHYETQTIKKITINPDGTFSEPTDHHKFNQKMGTNAHIQMSPDGKFLLYRPGKIKVYSLELKKDICGDLGGCHPSWGPRSKYFIRSKNGAFFNTGTSVKKLGSAGVGAYFQGFSNDAYWDEGRLWVIAPIGGGQNNEGSVEFREVAISNDGAWKLGAPTKVGRGSSSDIHMFPKDFDRKNPPKTEDPTNTIQGKINTLENGIAFTTQIKTATSGLQLVIHSMDQTGKIAELFDIEGKRVGFIKMSNSLKNIMPLNSIVNGRYILKVSDNNVSTHKSLFILR